MSITLRLLADGVLLAHLLFVAFVVAGLLLITIGAMRRWPWVRNRRFRLLHLAAIGYVAAQGWFNAICPLTLLENRLRELAGDAHYPGSFIAYWLRDLLYYEAPTEYFTILYTAFALLVLATWYWVRPEHPRRRSSHSDRQ